MTTGPLKPTALESLIEICDVEVFELRGSLCIGDLANATANLSSFEGDPTGFEAFVNHVHLGDVWHDGPGDTPGVEVLRRLAFVVIRCWAVSLLPSLHGRSVLFFAGGGSVEDFTIRFHLDRGPSDSWVDVGDQMFLKSRGLAVWRFGREGLEELQAW